jgi:hypothetical protein
LVNAALGGNIVARYNVLYFCTACRRIHPMGVTLPLVEGPTTTKHIGDAFAGKALPSHVAMLLGSSVTCPETGKALVLEDTNGIYLTPVLDPPVSPSKRA